MKNNDQQAAEMLLNNRIRKSKNNRLPVALRPQNCAQALDIQSEMIKQRHDDVKGWKCSLPLNKEQLVVAPIFADTVQTGEGCRLFCEDGKARIEPEIAFLLANDLPARETSYSEAEIDDSIEGCFMALELMQDRFSHQNDVTFYEKLADCLVNQGLFIGPEIDKQQAYLASEINISFKQSNNSQSFRGKHPNQLPQKPLYWLINYMTQRGVSFTAGQFIITGSYAGIVEVELNCSVEIQYSGLGSYQVTFTEG